MSLHVLADHMATRGRGPDSMLVHMAPQEVAGLQALAMKHGGTLTINPDTGLPEAGFLSKILPMLAGFALDAFVPGLGEMAGLGLSNAATAGIAVGGATTLATGSLSRGLMAGLGAYGGAGLSEGLIGAGGDALTRQALSMEGALPSLENITQVTGEGYGGSAANYSDQVNSAVKAARDTSSAMPTSELMSKGFDAAKADPLGFAKQNMMALGAAATPILAGAMVPTTTKMPEIGKSNDTINQYIYGPNGQYRRLNPVPAAGYGTPAHKPFADGGIVALAGGGDLNNIYANLGGKQVYDTIASNYMKAGGDEAGLASIMSKYDTPAAVAPAAAAPVVTAAAAPVVTAAAAPAYVAPDLTTAAGQQKAINDYTQGYFNNIASTLKTPAEQALELMYRSTVGGAPTGAFDPLGGYGKAKQIATAAGFDATPEWQTEYEKKMGYKVIPRMSTAESIALEKRLQAEQAAKDAAAGIATLPRIDAGADTTLNYTGDGTSTVKPVAVKSTGTYNTVAGNTYVPPAIGTAVGQGTYQGTGTMASTGTQGPIVDFTGKTAFTSNPLTLAKQQIADKAAAKTAADKAKLDLYSQFGIQNPTATKLDHVNFLDKIGLAPETAAQLLNISPDQAKDAYFDTKFNKQTGDSMAAYNYLMGKGAYPTKSSVGEIARPYAEATLGYPASTNRQYTYDQATGKYIRNPDYVAEYKDPTGGVNYLMSPSEIFQYFKKNQDQDDATTYAWAVENNLTPQEIAAATGVSLSQVAAKWRAAKAKQATAAADKKAADDKAAAANSQQDSSSTGGFAAGGMSMYSVGGGLGSLGSYSDGGRLLKGPGDGVSDSIPATIGQKQQPARLADGEFVVPARIVSELGNGSTEAGAKKLYAMMDRVQRARGKTTGKNKVAANSRADKYLPA